MTVRELFERLKNEDPNRKVVISNVLQSPFATVTIKEVITTNELYPDGPIYIRAHNKRRD